MPASTVEEYLRSLPDPSRSAVNEIRRIVKKVAPEALEVVSYGVLGYKMPPGDKRGFMFLGGYDKHVSIYPIPNDTSLQAELVHYAAGKGTLRFGLDKVLPAELIEKVVVSLYRDVI